MFLARIEGAPLSKAHEFYVVEGGRLITQPKNFIWRTIAQDFYYATKPDGYEALYALRDLFKPGTDKRKVIDFLIAEEKGAKKDIHAFDS